MYSCVCRKAAMHVKFHPSLRKTSGETKQRKQTLTNWLTHWLIDPLTDWLTDWLTHWPIDSLTEWLTDWFVWVRKSPYFTRKTPIYSSILYVNAPLKRAGFKMKLRWEGKNKKGRFLGNRRGTQSYTLYPSRVKTYNAVLWPYSGLKQTKLHADPIQA